MPVLERQAVSVPRRLIYRCQNRLCAKTRRLEVEHRFDVLSGSSPATGKPYRTIARERWIDPDTGRQVIFTIGCTCRGRMEATVVKGKLSDKVCGPRCHNAKGPDCDCSCAGDNHGKAHAAL